MKKRTLGITIALPVFLVITALFLFKSAPSYQPNHPAETLSDEIRFLDQEFHILKSKQEIIQLEGLKRSNQNNNEEIWSNSENNYYSVNYTFRQSKLKWINIYYINPTEEKIAEILQKLTQNLGEESFNNSSTRLWTIPFKGTFFKLVFQPFDTQESVAPWDEDSQSDDGVTGYEIFIYSQNSP